MAEGQTYTQDNRPIAVTTPLPKDTLLLVSISGQEGLSQLFSFHLELMTEDAKAKEVSFEKLLGKSITVTLTRPDKSKRYFNGVCSRISETGKDGPFTTYQMEIVPKLWLWSRKSHSRIFQNKTVPDILKKVLDGVQVEYKIDGIFQPRNYCVQYRETDFNFVSRLMEEEGIYYFFTYADGQHTMVIANTPQKHPDLTGGARIKYDEIAGGTRPDERIFSWQKVQELRSGKYALWDHHFQLPEKNLEAKEAGVSSLQVGRVVHKLMVEANQDLELYDFPGEYAQRFDGINRGGGEQPSEINKVFEDNKRTAKIRMQQEEMPSVVIHGASNCGHLVGGHKFKLERHPSAEGDYVLTSVSHSAQAGDFQSDSTDNFNYHNSFTCVPIALPFRPLRNTPKPMIPGAQTAVVVGPSGEEIFTDKYGRVKVQFFWDREGKKNEESSCWVRVGTNWAGGKWGSVHIPRIGQEVVVAFLEADPDAPIIVGSVYNADQMPPYELPANKTQSGVKSRSTPKGGAANFNELRFEDKKGSEDIYLHAEKDFHRLVEHDDDLKVGNDQTIEVKNNRTEVVKDGNETVTIEKGNRTVTVQTGNDVHLINKGNRTVQIDMGNDTLTIKMGNQTSKIDMGKSETEAMQSIELKVGQSSVKLDQTGVTIKGMMIKVEGQMQTQIKAPMTQVNGDAMLILKGGITMIN